MRLALLLLLAGCSAAPSADVARVCEESEPVDAGAPRCWCSADGVAVINLCAWRGPEHCEPCTVFDWTWTRCSLTEEGGRRSSSAYIRKLPWIHDGGVVAVSWGEQLEVPAMPEPAFRVTCLSSDPEGCR